MKKRKILFIGTPGSGKGTQAEFLKKYGFIHINPGEIIRKALKRNDKKFLPYKKKVESGDFIPDRVIFELVEKNTKNKDKYILDGSVRDLMQAKELVKRKLFDETIFFSLSKEESKKRLFKRKRLEGRVDDTKKVIENRFEEYDKRTKPAIEYLKKNSKLYIIDASPSIKKIHKEVLKVLGLKK